MNSFASLNQRLLWKEIRQVIPLILVLVILAVLISVWITFWDLRFNSSAYQVTACIPAILFSIGAGAVLVGQEKESRSLNWLNSLPVSPKHLIRHQFLFAFAMLAILWLVAFIVILFVARWGGQTSALDEETTTVAFVVFNSVYLLVCGFAMSWLNRSSVMGLISVLPLAVVPYITAYVVQYLVNWLGDPTYRANDPSPWMTASMLVLGIVGIGVLGYRVGYAQLTGQASRSPSRRERSWKASGERFVTTIDDFFRGDSRTKQRPLSASGTLLWQFRNQNRPILVSLIAAFTICFPIANSQIMGMNRVGGIGALVVTFCVVIAFSSLCWIATLTFQGDQIQNRVQFLAERGVSPTRVWWTRQLVPLRWMLIFSLIVTVFVILPRKDGSGQMLFAGCILYAVSQWLSQLIRPVAIVALLGPIASISAYVYGRATIDELATSPVIVVISLIVIPMLATWLMMRRWMEGRRGWSYWMTHGGLIVVAMVMPAFHYLRVYAFADGFSSRQKARLTFEAAESVAGVPASLDIQPTAEQYADQNWKTIADKTEQREYRMQAVDLASRHRDLLAALKDGLKKLQYDRMQSINLTPGLLQQYLVPPISLRMQLETDSTDDERVLSEYQDWMRTLPGLVSAMRNSLQLATQEAADLLEIFLLAELQNPKIASKIDDETRQAITDVTRASDARWAARRRALVYAANDILRDGSQFWQSERLGGVPLLTSYDVKRNAYEGLVHLRKTEHLIRTLLEYIDQARQGNSDYPLDDLVAYWDGSPAQYGLGPGGDFFRIDDVSKFAPSIPGSMPIAAQWGAGWEATADILLQTNANLEVK